MIKFLATAVALGALMAGTAGSASSAPDPGCQSDSKLVGRILLSTADVPGTWWHLTREGFDDAGITDYEAAIEQAFGTTFATLDDAVEALVDAVRSLDRNGNDYVCASSLRGRRAFLGDPNYAEYYFGTQDDKHVTD